MLVDPDGRLGTVPISAAGNPGKAPGVQPDAQKEAMIDGKVRDLRATVSQQQQKIEKLTAQLNEQAAQIQKASAQIEMYKPSAKVVTNKR